MLIDIPYKNIKDNGRKYGVWLLRDVYGNTFADIARGYGVSQPIVISDYRKILMLKKKYYVNHLSIVKGHNDIVHFRKIARNAYDCYYDMKYVVAYLEKEYYDILREYRNGEPGMPEQMLRDLPPLRKRFSKQTIFAVVRLRETNRMTYGTIGKRLYMTKEKAEDLYNRYYHALNCSLIEKIVEMTGDTNLGTKYWETYQIGSSKNFFDCLIKEYPELCENILNVNNRK